MLENMKVDLRKDTILKISTFEYDQALTNAYDLIKISKRLFFHEPGVFFYAYTVDTMLMIKCQIRNDLVQLAEESLIQLWEYLEKFLTDSNFKLTKMNSRVINEKEEKKIDRLVLRILGKDKKTSDALFNNSARYSEANSAVSLPFVNQNSNLLGQPTV
jgi:hypothetical protein